MTGRYGIGVVALAAMAAVFPCGGRAQERAAPIVPIVYPAPLSPFAEGLSEGLADSPALLQAYAARGYAPLWTTDADETRRTALFAALDAAPEQGLPARRYAGAALRAAFGAAGSERDRGLLEARVARAWALYTRDISNGLLNPKRVDPGIVREIPRRDTGAMLAEFAVSPAPAAWLRGLIPRDPRYGALLQARAALARQAQAGGWGAPVPEGTTLHPGESGPAVTALRARLQKMGYLGAETGTGYDPALRRAVRDWQADMGLSADGVAGAATLAAINRPVEERLRAVTVALERLRWMNGLDLGQRHVWVNITDYHARIVDHDETVFDTVTVVGQNEDGRRTPEFSDQMEMIVINPSWHVPRSISVREYLPMMQRNPNAAAQIMLVDSGGRIVPRSAVDFAAYDENSFPYRMRQDPSDDNALGQVKFLFPNPWNIYLHDTPSKALFQRETRAFSHGCIRIGKPFDLAYALLAPQQPDAETYFQDILKTGKETVVTLDPPVPVHLVYFTAWPDGAGRIEYRDDVYGRDAALWAAMERAGVDLTAVSD